MVSDDSLRRSAHKGPRTEVRANAVNTPLQYFRAPSGLKQERIVLSTSTHSSESLASLGRTFYPERTSFISRGHYLMYPGMWVDAQGLSTKPTFSSKSRPNQAASRSVTHPHLHPHLHTASSVHPSLRQSRLRSYLGLTFPLTGSCLSF